MSAFIATVVALIAKDLGQWLFKSIQGWAADYQKAKAEAEDAKKHDDAVAAAREKVKNAVTPEEQEAADAELENTLNSRR